MHDPTQAYSTLGAYSGATPFGVPYGALQTPGINPFIAHQWAQAMGISPAFSGYQHPGQVGLTGGWQNPFGQNPFGQNPFGQNPFGQNPLSQLTQGIQNPLLYAGLQNPQLQQALLQNPMLHPLLQNQLLQNPLLQHSLMNPIQAQLQAHAQQLALQAYAAQAGGASPYGVGSLYGQTISPFTQQGLPSVPGISPLAPQTWVGQGSGIGYGQGQSIQHPLAQLVGRGFQGPWAGF
jgi:hypothetical protein